MRYFRIFFGIVGGLVLSLVFVSHAQAATYTYNQKAVLQTTLAGDPVKLFDGKFRGGASVAVADVNGDGLDEYVVGAAAGGGPMVQVFRHDGTLLWSWFAYPKSFSGGINVAAGDLDGDGTAEIVVTPASNRTGQISIFSGQGVLQKRFAIYAKSYTNGFSVAVLPAHNGSDGNIIVGTQGGPNDEVRVYTRDAKFVTKWNPPFSSTFDPGVTVAAAWNSSLNAPVVIVGAGPSLRSVVMVYNLKTHKAIASWQAYPGKTPGVRVSAVDGQVITAPMGGVATDVRTYTLAGKLLSTDRAFDDSFRGGAYVAAYHDGGTQVAVVPSRIEYSAAAASGKMIKVSLSKQTLSMYENGRLVSTRRVSTGKWSTPTPIGTYYTRNKIAVAYSSPYHLYMEYWMAFTPDGSYGLHALAFWKLKNGGKLYEGASHIGTPVSHGCVRQSVAEAKSLYDWAPVGTPVVITK